MSPVYFIYFLGLLVINLINFLNSSIGASFIILELSLIFFMYFINFDRLSIEPRLKYFIIQTLSSLLFILSLLCLREVYNKIIIRVSIIIKIGL